ncbi:MAG: hypothetical protein BWZ01_03002 [Deltaproteobacteria bacterium ADurb.BinA179]|jgi:hypothetical protein|nr:MAG: hypothetical protein BWZ01_03002 [Deltaproteobacteria bacterium ADurb.BinA179]OQC18502.1 MAG: hypothetical protein BWX71_02799 [Deltaproteobacteria bacterium ADurb.Bin072]
MKDAARKILTAVVLATCLILVAVTVQTCRELRNMQWSMEQLEQRVVMQIQQEREHQAGINLVLAREIDKTNARISRLKR